MTIPFSKVKGPASIQPHCRARSRHQRLCDDAAAARFGRESALDGSLSPLAPLVNLLARQTPAQAHFVHRAAPWAEAPTCSTAMLARCGAFPHLRHMPYASLVVFCGCCSADLPVECLRMLC